MGRRPGLRTGWRYGGSTADLQRLDIVRGKGLAPDTPLPTGHVNDTHPGYATHGLAYDLLGFWYTFEAKTMALADPAGCPDGAEAGCELVYSDYRPLAARLRLVQDGTSRYSGGIFVTRNGQEVLAGSVSITFGAGNDAAVIEARAGIARCLLAEGMPDDAKAESDICCTSHFSLR